MALPRLELNKHPFRTPELPAGIRTSKRIEPVKIEPATAPSYLGAALLIGGAIGLVLLPSPWDVRTGWVALIGIVGLWAWWFISDFRKLATRVQALPAVEPSVAPRVVFPLRHVLVPLVAIFVLGISDFDVTLDGFSLGSVVRFVAATFVAIYVAAVEFMRYRVLPSDSVEASARRDAAGISFLILTAGWWAFAFVAVPWLSNSSGEIVWTVNHLVAYAPVILSSCLYSASLLILKKMRT